MPFWKKLVGRISAVSSLVGFPPELSPWSCADRLELVSLLDSELSTPTLRDVFDGSSISSCPSSELPLLSTSQ